MNAVNPMIGHNNPPTDPVIMAEVFSEKYQEILARAEELIEASTRIPTEFLDEETAVKAISFIPQITEAKKKLESVRVSEKEPYLNLGRIVDGFFKVRQDRLDAAKSKAQRPLDDFMKKKEAERRRQEMAEQQERARIASEQAEHARLLEAQNKPAEAAAVLDAAIASEAQAQRHEDMAQAKPAELARTRSDTGALATLRTSWVGEITDREALDLESLRQHIPADALQKALNSFIKAGGRNLRGASIFEKTETVVR